NPFNFVPQQYTVGSSLKGKVSHEALERRKGHKYRHSSIHVSHMDAIVRPPPVKSPLTVPQSLPVPTRSEAWRSLTPSQTVRLVWCVCHFLIASFVQYSGRSSLAMTALSRLLLFDAAGASVCVAVDVMGNFEVWKRSSIKHPFGLERADVLAGFALAVFIGFMGLDIISHGTKHSLENLGQHQSHSPHSHRQVTTAVVSTDTLLAMLSTIVSAVLLQNHARIGRAMRLERIASWSRIVNNPSHVLTLSCSVLLLFLPSLSGAHYKTYDLLLSFIVAGLMIAFGVRLGSMLASMLLMSYRPRKHDRLAVQDIISDIERTGSVTKVEEVKMWQVHYGLCMANLKLQCLACGHDTADEWARLRQRITSLIRQRLGETWEITVQIAEAKD
ncbi:hypothetical protein K470DRAFT_200967, partial [Piedraia hortae CBS 480.64]